MKLNTLILTSALIVSAQQIVPIAAPVQSPLTKYLTLTESQVASLQKVQSDKRQAESAIYRQISERQTQLNALLQQGSNDAANIGRLMVEINNLRRQLPLPSSSYRSAALGVLTDAQKTKLPALSEALKLIQPANEAVYLNLIDAAPLTPTPRPLPMPVALTSATVDSEP